MPEEAQPDSTSLSSSTPSPATPSANPETSAPIPFNIGEEFSSPAKKLPPAGIVAICVVAIAIVVGLIAFLKRPQSQATGSIDTVTSVGVPGQESVIVAINVSIQNRGEHLYWIHEIKVDLEAGGQTLSDTPVSAVDYERYYQAFPDLKRAPLDPLKVEDKIRPGETLRGTILAVFPVSPEVFAQRKLLTLTIQPYDQPLPLVLKNTP